MTTKRVLNRKKGHNGVRRDIPRVQKMDLEKGWACLPLDDSIERERDLALCMVVDKVLKDHCFHLGKRGSIRILVPFLVLAH